MSFELVSKYKPSGDQPKAIESLLEGLKQNKQHQVLLGATGTGKTFTIANIIAKSDSTTLVLSHNKTLAAQLYMELKSFFPNDRVEYFISNFDYYRPEAYLPSSDTFIDKSSKTNWDIEAMRMNATNSLVSGQRTIVVASVASIYGLIPPSDYHDSIMEISVNDKLKLKDFFATLVQRSYARNNVDLKPGTFRVKGDVIELMPIFIDDAFYRIDTFDGKIESIKKISYPANEVVKTFERLTIYPANSYVTSREKIDRALKLVRDELKERITYFEKENKLLEKQRLEQRVNADIDSLQEYGTVAGIENYSAHLEGRSAGTRPYTILDYLSYNSIKRSKKPLLVIDESHMMIPQLNAMYNGDRSRKMNLVEYGFRLPSALDNRPLKFSEWENDFEFSKIYVSATPAEYEIDKAQGEVVSQIIRPTGLIDPSIEIVPTKNQVEDIYDRIQKQKVKKERTFILTTTKRMAEELTNYLLLKKEKVAYLHSDHKTFERDEILRKLRLGIYDTVIGVNLIREGLDIPEVSLICIIDADKESFFRSTTSLIQIIGRGARNVNGHVVMYGDKMTKSMEEAIEETDRRRNIQIEYNKKHGIIPQTVIKEVPEPLNPEVASNKKTLDPHKMSNEELKKEIASLRGKMLYAAKQMDFERAAQIRDYILELETILTN